MIGFCPLASGSKGNALFLGTKKTRLLIDAGLPFSQLKSRLESLGVCISSIQAVLVTHEHIDHIKGIKALTDRYRIPIFANVQTARGIDAACKEHLRYKFFSTGEPFVFEDLYISPFSISHDTLDPVGFTIEYDGIKLGVCTDLGFVSSSIKKRLEKCHYLYVEANHEPSMLFASARPDHLKQRIRGKQGHLSNEECASLLSSVYHEELRHIFLAHLSSDCNREEVALEKVIHALREKGPLPEISIAYQAERSKPIFFEALKSPALAL